MASTKIAAVNPSNQQVDLEADANGNLKVTSGATGASADQIQGNVASGATDSGNPVKVGGKYNATPPSPSDGQRLDLQLGARGSVRVELFQAGSGNVINSGVTADGAANSGIVTLIVDGRMSAFNGTTWDRLRGNTTGQIVIPPGATNGWNYAAATGGIDNTTTAVTIKAAAGASVRNYITSIQVQTATLGAATELAIRDGAGGTVLWRTQLQTTALPLTTINFATPIFSTANTLLEVVTLTAVTGDVMFNAQGYTAP